MHVKKKYACVCLCVEGEKRLQKKQKSSIQNIKYLYVKHSSYLVYRDL